MKKLILTSLALLISISVYSQSASNNEKGQSTSTRPAPSDISTFVGYENPNAPDIQSIAVVSIPSVNNISKIDTAISKNEADKTQGGGSDKSVYKTKVKNQKPCAKAYEESDFNVKKAEAEVPGEKEKAEPAR